MNLSEDDCLRNIRHEYPYLVEKWSSVTIILDDNIKLAANIWMPKNVNEEKQKFSSILEYLPYRKADWTANRDEKRLKYFAGFGYVSIRVDIKGTGNSEGLFDDEYSYQEQSDGLKILQWIENQSWSNGKIVIYGKSWGGFNGLQLGYLQPKSLYGIISAYSTDDRYSDDIHYTGGCVSAQEALLWSTQMLVCLSLPPHPEYQGGIDQDADLINIWKERLNNLTPLDSYWFKHQNRNNYWRNGSICEDYSKILCPVMLIGGFADLYTDTVFRLINQLKCPKRALIGPWGHDWPDTAYPGPQIGFLQEVIEWLDYYISGIDNGYQNKEILSIYQLYPNSSEIDPFVRKRKGKWIHLNQIPDNPNEHFTRNNNNNQINREEFNQKQIKYYLSFGCLTNEMISNNNSPKKISFLSPQETGISGGCLLGYGSISNLSNPIDQREDDGRSLSFDSLPLTNNYELFGFPVVKLNLSSNTNSGLICVRLSMIDENNGSSILLSRGIINLTHYKSHEHPEQLNIDQIYNIEISLSSICISLPSGCRLRLSLSTSYWPIVWPSPELSTLTIHFDESSPCFITLPCLDNNYLSKDYFGLPEVAQGIQLKVLRQSSTTRFRISDEANQIITLEINEDEGAVEYPDGLIFDESAKSIYKIKKNDPQSARIEIQRFVKYYFKDQSKFQVNIKTNSIMFTKQLPSTFEIQHQLDIYNKDQLFFNKNWNLTFPRFHN